MRPRRYPRLCLDRGQQVFAGQFQLTETRADLAHTCPPPIFLGAEPLLQTSAGGVDPKSQHVNGLSAPRGRDFDAGHELYPRVIGFALGVVQAGDGVVIGQRQHAEPCGAGSLHQFGRGQGAVGAVRVRMQVDGKALGHVGAPPASPTASSCCPASTMKPCERSKPSLV